MESFFARYRNPLTLVALVLIQVIMLASQIGRNGRVAHLDHPDGHSVRLIRLWAETAVSPFERVFGALGHGVRFAWHDYFALRSTRKENEQLKAELDRLRLEQAALAEDARQGHRLQALLDFREHYITATVAAQVIGTSGSDQSQVLYVNKGSKDGIKPDMPVITPDGIVGRVRDVFPGTSQVLLINDPSSGAGVLLETTRIRGVVRGNGYGQLEIINVMPDDRIKPGEPVIASGGDQIFPRGMPVGTVARVQHDPAHDPYVQVLVTPAANLSQLEEVLIVTGAGQTPPSSLAADLARSEALAEQQKKAAEVLAEKLPTVKPEEVQANELATGPDRPHQPPQPLQPDRFSPGDTPPATAMQPGKPPPPIQQTIQSLPAKAQPAHAAAKPAKAAAQEGDRSEPAPKAKSAAARPASENSVTEKPAPPQPEAEKPATPKPEKSPALKPQTVKPESENPGANPPPAEKP
jgi:rod shape-determining protein MreC